MGVWMGRILHWIRRDFSFVGAGAKYRVLTAADCAPTLITMRLLLPETFMQRYKTILLIVQFLCLMADFLDLQFIGHKDCFFMRWHLGPFGWRFRRVCSQIV